MSKEYASMSDEERYQERFQDEMGGDEEEGGRPRKSGSKPKKKKSRPPAGEEVIKKKKSSRHKSSKSKGDDGLGEDTPRRSHRQSARTPETLAASPGASPGAVAARSLGVDQAVKVADDEEEPSSQAGPGDEQRRPASQKQPKEKREVNKDFKDLRETGRWGAISKREIYAVLAIGVAIVIAVVVVVVVLTTRGGGEESTAAPVETPPPAPTAAPTVPVVKTPQEQLDLIRAATIDNPATASSLELLPEDVDFYVGKADDATASPVVRAASWIMYDDPVDNDEWLLIRYALATLYHSTGGPTWTNTTGWLVEENACEWYGVRCDRFDERVEEIDLSENKLAGTMPNELGLMPTLISLWLRRNNVTGNIPNLALGRLSSLSILYLESNQLSGEVTADLAASGSLKTLFIQENNLIGFLPIEFCPRSGVGGLLEFGIDCDDMECFCCAPENCF